MDRTAPRNGCRVRFGCYAATRGSIGDGPQFTTGKRAPRRPGRFRRYRCHFGALRFWDRRGGAQATAASRVAIPANTPAPDRVRPDGRSRAARPCRTGGATNTISCGHFGTVRAHQATWRAQQSRRSVRQPPFLRSAGDTRRHHGVPIRPSAMQPGSLRAPSLRDRPQANRPRADRTADHARRSRRGRTRPVASAARAGPAAFRPDSDAAGPADAAAVKRNRPRTVAHRRW
jgi:hypothetical protein